MSTPPSTLIHGEWFIPSATVMIRLASISAVQLFPERSDTRPGYAAHPVEPARLLIDLAAGPAIRIPCVSTAAAKKMYAALQEALLRVRTIP